MIQKRLFYLATFGLPLITIYAFNASNSVTNYFGIDPLINFNENTYKLSWSSHPNESFYKQEYLPGAERSGSFNNMLLIDFVITDKSPKEALTAQVMMLNDRKKTDPICNYAISKKDSTEEYMLDFVMGQYNGDKTSTVEWNAYHYKSYIDSAGHKGVLLFGYSHRAYDDKTTAFLRSLKIYRNELIKKVAGYPVPKIQLR